MKKNALVILGPPGSGKGTVSKELEQKHNYIHLSTGNIFKQNINQKTELGLIVQEKINNGILIDDQLTKSLVKDFLLKTNLENKTILFDGYPRTDVQFEDFFNILDKLDIECKGAIYLKTNKKLLIKRLSNRLTCKQCSSSFNLLTIKPKKEGICDYCNGKLYQRGDDMPESIEKRFNEYETKTANLVNLFSQKSFLYEIDADASVEKTINQILAIEKNN